MISELESISDTALWVAAYRAMETARPDALLKDPWARSLAGERGFEIARAMPRSDYARWLVVVRTLALDGMISRTIAGGRIDTVVNLAAGLDTRPYRMDLPAGLRWIEADYPGVIEYKEERLAGTKPRCALERVGLDLAEPEARRGLLEQVGRSSRRALVLTEGFLVYLEPAATAALARELSSINALCLWLLDYASHETLEATRRAWGERLKAGRAEMRWAVDDLAWFGPLGWEVAENRSLVEENLRLQPKLSMRLLGRLGWALLAEENKAQKRRMNGFALLKRGRR